MRGWLKLLLCQGCVHVADGCLCVVDLCCVYQCVAGGKLCLRCLLLAWAVGVRRG